MLILRTAQDLRAFFTDNDCKVGCFADTSFLYATAYTDDRLFEKATDTFNLLSEHEVPIYANVISRMEFIDLILRKQITKGCIELYDQMGRSPQTVDLYNLLKNIRDRNTAALRTKESFKIGESQLKNLRKLIVDASTGSDWTDFCAEYLDGKFVSEWRMIEDELGLNFVEVLEDTTSEFFREPLRWNDMVQIMGKHGLRGPDAMIANLFLKSRFPLLITGDSDFEHVLEGSEHASGKAVFIL